MLDIGADAGPDPKCYFTATQLPQKIEDKQLPTKKPPFSTINAHAFNHTVQILLPTPLEQHHASSVEQRLHTILDGKQYAKVHLKPADLIHGDFFNQYIKAGNVIMRSQGRLGVDNIFLLHDGILRIELDKLTYERAGLQGKPMPSPGRTHVKQRFVIELNLRLPSMVRGRPLFNRLVYAFDNVLTDTLTWLFYDLKDPTLSTPSVSAPQTTKPPEPQSPARSKPQPESEPKDTPNNNTNEHKTPLTIHAAITRPLTLQRTSHKAMLTPRSIPVLTSQADELEATELLEWLQLAIQGCARLAADDGLDAYLSRYVVPRFCAARARSGSGSGEDESGGANSDESKDRMVIDLDSRAEDADTDTDADADAGADAGAEQGVRARDLTVFEINAFMPSGLVTKIFTAVLKAGLKDWFAMRVQAFDTSSSYTVLVQKTGHCMVWQCD